MATTYSNFDTTPANLVADLKAKILLSTDWANITGNIVKATTTRGAQMVVDLADSAATSVRAQLGVYRTHDGTTGVDKVVRYISWRNAGGATSDNLHVRVSAGKEHLYIDIEGPRGGEANAVDSFNGSVRQVLFVGDIVPYFGGDTIPAVAMYAATSAGNFLGMAWHVSRNQANNASWVVASAASLQVPTADSHNTGYAVNSLQPIAAGDGKTYMWPYVIVEQTDGIRGRLQKAFFCGFNTQAAGESTVPTVYSKRSYGGETYILLNPSKSGGISDVDSSGFGSSGMSSGSYTQQSAIVAIPFS
jgi:hypothetical protein